MPDPIFDLKASEEAKRERNWDPAERWKVLQATITWAESQLTVRRNTSEACRRKEDQILASMEQAGLFVRPASLEAHQQRDTRSTNES